MRICLVDLENVNRKGLTGADRLSASDKVVVFYSENASSVNIDLIIRCRASVKFIKVDVGTANALDFQLVGYLFHKMKKSDEYYIVSKDKGYTAIIRMAERYGGKVSLVDCISDIMEECNKDNYTPEVKTEKNIKTGNVIRIGDRRTESLGYGLDSKSEREIAGLIKGGIGKPCPPELLRLVIDGIRKSSSKSEFYSYCIRSLGQALGGVLYSCIKAKYSRIKENVDNATYTADGQICNERSS